MTAGDPNHLTIEQDIWTWIENFVTAPNEAYSYKFAPCPFARQAVQAKTVDVRVWQTGEVREFIRKHAIQMRDTPHLTTRVMAFPPRTRLHWGIHEYVESLNTELIPTNVFLNAGVAKTTTSQYPNSSGKEPYFIVIANSLDAVLSAAESLSKTDFYANWPAAHYAHVVERRARLAKQYGNHRNTQSPDAQ
jgi:hypothetical protein